MNTLNGNVTCFSNLNTGSEAFKALDKKGLLGKAFTTNSGEVRHYINSKAFAESLNDWFLVGKVFISEKGVTFEQIVLSPASACNREKYASLEDAMKAEIPNAFKAAMKAGV